MFFPAQREREPHFSSAWCISGLVTVCHYVQKGYRGKNLTFLFSSQREIDSLLILLHPLSSDSQQLHFTDARTNKKINDHGVGMSETHWADFHFTSKQNFCVFEKTSLERQNHFLLTDEAWSPWSLVLAFPWREVTEQSGESDGLLCLYTSSLSARTGLQPLCICLLTISFTFIGIHIWA